MCLYRVRYSSISSISDRLGLASGGEGVLFSVQIDVSGLRLSSRNFRCCVYREKARKCNRKITKKMVNDNLKGECLYGKL